MGNKIGTINDWLSFMGGEADKMGSGGIFGAHTEGLAIEMESFIFISVEPEGARIGWVEVIGLVSSFESFESA